MEQIISIKMNFGWLLWAFSFFSECIYGVHMANPPRRDVTTTQSRHSRHVLRCLHLLVIFGLHIL